MSIVTLIIDDDALICTLHAEVLKYTGFSEDPQSFYNGLEALQFLKQNYTADDKYLIFLDINMPVMNGWGFLDALEKDFRDGNFFIFVVSSSLMYEDREKAAYYPKVVKYVEKPLNFNLAKEIYDLIFPVCLSS